MSELGSEVPGDKAGHEAHAVEADGAPPRTAIILLLVIVGTLVLGGVVIGIDQVFRLTTQEEISRKVLEVESSALRLLRAEEQARLTRYQWIDQSKGVLRIPLDRAMQLLVAEWAQAADETGSGAASPIAPQAPSRSPVGQPPR